MSRPHCSFLRRPVHEFLAKECKHQQNYDNDFPFSVWRASIIARYTNRTDHVHSKNKVMGRKWRLLCLNVILQQFLPDLHYESWTWRNHCGLCTLERRVPDLRALSLSLLVIFGKLNLTCAHSFGNYLTRLWRSSVRRSTKCLVCLGYCKHRTKNKYRPG